MSSPLKDADRPNRALLQHQQQIIKKGTTGISFKRYLSWLRATFLFFPFRISILYMLWLLRLSHVSQSHDALPSISLVRYESDFHFFIKKTSARFFFVFSFHLLYFSRNQFMTRQNGIIYGKEESWITYAEASRTNYPIDNRSVDDT